jgi:hypothetical protein
MASARGEISHSYQDNNVREVFSQAVFSASKGQRVRKKFLVALLLLISAISPAAANIIYVDCSGPNDPGTGTFEDPFRRIQDGINASPEGDTVLIRPGVYSGPGNFNLDPQSKSIIIRSSDPNDLNIISQTIINPVQQGRGFHIYSQEDTNCIISGLTITDACSVDSHNGAGIYCFDSSPTIQNCIIRNGYAEGAGGGICLDHSSAKVIDCTITGNKVVQPGYGGGISCRFSSPVIAGCTISGNTAESVGGGINSGESETNIVNCIIVDNNTTAGGGINCYYTGDVNVINCTIVANKADDAGGAVYCWLQSNVAVKNSIIWANETPDGNGTQIGLLGQETAAAISYCDVQGGLADVFDPCGLLVWGQGNIDIDPCFALFDPNSDSNLWDFHLQSKYGRWNTTFYRIDFDNSGIINLADFAELASVWLEYGNLREDLDYSGVVDWPDMGLFAQYYLANKFEDGWLTDINTSSCIDAGEPNIDWSPEPWPNGKRINMGSYGGTAQAGKSGNLADFNIDGRVDFLDFAALARFWNEDTASIEDLIFNGRIDIYDLDRFCIEWLKQD